MNNGINFCLKMVFAQPAEKPQLPKGIIPACPVLIILALSMRDGVSKCSNITASTQRKSMQLKGDDTQREKHRDYVQLVRGQRWTGLFFS
jgi:hypothetical protein